MSLTNPTKNRLMIWLRDLARPPHNTIGMWLLQSRLAWPYWVAAIRRRLGLEAARPAGPPPLWPTTRAWYQRAGTIQAAEGARYMTVFPARHLAMPAARRLAGGRRDPWRLHSYRNSDCPAAFVASVPKGRFDGRTCEALTADGRLLADVSFHGPGNRYAESRDYARRMRAARPPAEARPIRRLPGSLAAIASIMGDWNYFHWMFQTLPRLELLRAAGVTHDQVDWFGLDVFGKPFHAETLDRLGVPRDKIIQIGDGELLTADRLWVCSGLRSSGHRSPWAVDFLRREFLSGRPVTGAERLYVGRADSGRRRLANEPEIVARLERLGFCAVTPGQYTVADQARLFAGARVVVALHGAGLVNLAFCETGTKVLELFAPQWRSMSYWELSNVRQLDYRYLIGEAASTPTDAEAFCVPSAWLDNLLAEAGVR